MVVPVSRLGRPVPEPVEGSVVADPEPVDRSLSLSKGRSLPFPASPLLIPGLTRNLHS